MDNKIKLFYLLKLSKYILFVFDYRSMKVGGLIINKIMIAHSKI
jgi:hypothetical protein